MRCRSPRRLPEVLTPGEQSTLLNWLSNRPGIDALRAYALVRLFLVTGLRAREIRELRADSIDWTSGRFKVRGKGGRERVLRLAPCDLDLLRRWLRLRPTSSNRLTSSNLVFTSLDGRKPLCARWLRTLIKRLAKQAGIQKDIHPHTLRHTFATNLLAQERNLFMVSKALGHANISTTQIYLHLHDGELENALVRLGNGGD
jgi:integrase/recombinase XerC